MGRIRRSTKALSVDIYERSDGRYHVVSKDETGGRHYATRLSLSDAKKLQSEKIGELQRHREGRFNLDDREMLSQARDLASIHGYTVLQSRRFDPARFGTCASFARFSSGTAEHLPD